MSCALDCFNELPGLSGAQKACMPRCPRGGSDSAKHACLHTYRYLDVSCLVFGADHVFLEPIDYDHRISTEAVGKQGAVQHSGEGPLQHATPEPAS